KPVGCPERELLYAGVFLGTFAALFASGTIGVLAATSVSPTLAQPSSASVRATQVFGLPMQFEKNAGQTDHQVEFLARGLGYTVFLTPTQAVFSLRSVTSSAAAEKRAGRHNHRRSRGDLARLEMDLLDANPGARGEGQDE